MSSEFEKRVPNETVAELIRLRGEGVTVLVAAKKLGLSRSTAYYLLGSDRAVEARRELDRTGVEAEVDDVRAAVAPPPYKPTHALPLAPELVSARARATGIPDAEFEARQRETFRREDAAREAKGYRVGCAELDVGPPRKSVTARAGFGIRSIPALLEDAVRRG